MSVNPFQISGGSGRSEGSGGSGRHTPDNPPEGAALLDEVREWLARYITVMRESDLDVLTVWAAHTHLAADLYTTPRLQVDSPVPESGKTTVLEHLLRLCHEPILAASISSPALLARLVRHGPRTILLDEVDRTLNPKLEGVGELVALLNSGYKVGATRPTLVPVKGGGWQEEEMPTFAPVALAGNQPNLPDDTRTRIIRVLLLPDWEGRAWESDWELLDLEARNLGVRLAEWADSVRDRVSERPEMPPGVTARFREKWQPLARVARAAGGRWPEAIDRLAADDVEQRRLDQEEGLAVEKPAVLLLRHLLAEWPETIPFRSTSEIISTLVRDHPDVWGDGSPIGKALTPQRLGRMLTSAYGIRSQVEDTADKYSPRGYRRAAFGAAADALSRRSGGSSPLPPGKPPEPPEPSEPPEAGPANCTVCAEPLSPAITAGGFTTHPGCEVAT